MNRTLGNTEGVFLDVVMTRIASTDVVVAGGGPAGATIAATLASYGHDVMLIEKYRFPRDQIGESLTPSIIPLLTTVGIRETVEKAGFLRMAGHTVCLSLIHI